MKAFTASSWRTRARSADPRSSHAVASVWPSFRGWCTAHHVARNADFVIAAAADPPTLRQYGRDRGWHRLRLLSCGDSTFKYDLESEDEDGAQDSTVSVFTRDGDGTVRLTYSAHPRMADDIQERGIDLLTPVWHLLDPTPQGRGDWYPAIDCQ
ncbi:DUF899 family protein [Streptomyces sp. NPDC002172]